MGVVFVDSSITSFHEPTMDDDDDPSHQWTTPSLSPPDGLAEISFHTFQISSSSLPSEAGKLHTRRTHPMCIPESTIIYSPSLPLSVARPSATTREPGQRRQQKNLVIESNHKIPPFVHPPSSTNYSRVIPTDPFLLHGMTTPAV